MNVIGVTTQSAKGDAAAAPLIEPLPAAALVPQDLHAAQLARRLAGRRP